MQAAKYVTLIEKNDGDVEKALFEFYSPIEADMGGKQRWARGTLYDFEANAIKGEIRKVVYSITQGFERDGICGEYISTIIPTAWRPDLKWNHLL